MCKKYLEIVQNFQVVTYNKEGLPGKKLCIFSGDWLFTKDASAVNIKALRDWLV